MQQDKRSWPERVYGVMCDGRWYTSPALRRALGDDSRRAHDNIQGTLHRLLRKGYVERCRHPADRGRPSGWWINRSISQPVILWRWRGPAYDPDDPRARRAREVKNMHRLPWHWRDLLK